MRIVFMGTPDFAVPSLERLIADGHQVVGVYTQPDKPKNRGMKLTASPVKEHALAHGIPVFQPTTLKDDAVFEELCTLAPELIVVAAYGKILPKRILDCPEKGCINVHSSLLPRYRGAAPINWAILNGEDETGVTIMYMAEGLDTGDIISQRATPIDPNESVETLHDRLAALGASLLSETVVSIADGTATRRPQDDAQSNYAPMLNRELSPVDFTRSARQIHDQIRGLVPWPAACMEVEGLSLKLFASDLPGEESELPPGTILGADKKGMRIVCGDGKVLRILELQAPGKKRMRAVDYLRGHPLTRQ
ncbi:MAG: methionyl-tRNA formyltransferase [Oscillospiraceae bacterium]|nr:methionyl-tRNA formyltransferase [Oscillospiraceae bacterium]